MDLLPRLIGKNLLLQRTGKLAMTYSYTQITQYLRCPRSYRYRYLDGWKEKDTRATLLFGRSFEQALGAYFRGEDSSAALFTEWAKYQEAQLEYSHGDSWERMFRQGVQLLERLAQEHKRQMQPVPRRRAPVPIFSLCWGLTLTVRAG